jgi:hypothetical protein
VKGWLIVYGTMLSIFFAILAVGMVKANAPAPQVSAPTWTAAPCARWADEASPQLPPFTYTDRCVAPDGTIDIAPDVQLVTK